MPFLSARCRRPLSALAVLVLGFAWGGAPPAGAAEQAPTAYSGMRPIRDREVSGDAPTISFIDSPTATCYRAQELGQACYVEWNYLYVAATAPQYIVGMTIELDGRLRAAFEGFFQTAMFVPSGLYAPGLRVACGLPGAGGVPGHGMQYAYAIRASETGGLSAANYGSVLCPATRYIFVDGFASGNSSAWSAAVP